jgi:D-lactate dehydrogenase
MARIVFYDTSELDAHQLGDALKETDHHFEFIEGHISLDSLRPDAEVISVFASSTVTREMIEALPRLTLICCRSTGYDNVDVSAASERGVTVVNVPTYGDATVAEYAFTMLLALLRKLPAVLEVEQRPFTAKELTGSDLFGKTFGVIGAGRIGQKALKIANGFSMRTLAYDPFPNHALQEELHFEYVGLERLLGESDIVSLHVPYTKENHHLIGKSEFQMMKPGAVLVNTARGALVDTPALIEVLQSGRLRGAALDVVEGETLLNFEEEVALLARGAVPADALRHSVELSVLKKMPNVILSPHNAYNTVDAIGRINSTTVQNIINFYNGTMPHKVEPRKKTTGTLILVRHTESEWNALGIWSGITDVPLSKKGEEDCALVGKALKDLGVHIDIAFYTDQKRTSQTLEGICKIIGDDMQKICEPGFNERNYGEYTGMDKWRVKEEVGEERFHEIRRGWDVPFPNGETLRQVYERVVSAYQTSVLPLLREGKNVLIVGHGNGLRALMKYLESISDEEIANLEMPMGEIIVYDIDPQGRKEAVRRIDTGVRTSSHF